MKLLRILAFFLYLSSVFAAAEAQYATFLKIMDGKQTGDPLPEMKEMFEQNCVVVRQVLQEGNKDEALKEFDQICEEAAMAFAENSFGLKDYNRHHRHFAHLLSGGTMDICERQGNALMLTYFTILKHDGLLSPSLLNDSFATEWPAAALPTNEKNYYDGQMDQTALQAHEHDVIHSWYVVCKRFKKLYEDLLARINSKEDKNKKALGHFCLFWIHHEGEAFYCDKGKPFVDVGLDTVLEAIKNPLIHADVEGMLKECGIDASVTEELLIQIFNDFKEQYGTNLSQSQR